MSGFAIRGAANGPYGPANPPPPPPGQPPASRQAAPARYNPPPQRDKTAEEIADKTATKKAKNERKRQRKADRLRAERQDEGHGSSADVARASVKQQGQADKVRSGDQHETGDGPTEQPHDRDMVAEMHDRGKQSVRSQADREHDDSRAERYHNSDSRDNHYRARRSSDHRDYRSRSPLQHRNWQDERTNKRSGNKMQSTGPADEYRPRYRSRSPIRGRDESYRGGVRSPSGRKVDNRHDQKYWMHDRWDDDRNDDWNRPRQSHGEQRLQPNDTGAHRDHGFATEDEVDWEEDYPNADTGNKRTEESTVPPWAVREHASPVAHDRQSEESRIFREQEERRTAWMSNRSGGHQVDARPHENQFDRNPRPQTQHSEPVPGYNTLAKPIGIPKPGPRQDIGPVPDTVQNLAAYDAKIQKIMPALGLRHQDSTPQGKAKTYVYGAHPSRDLGLCHATFLTPDECSMGQSCLWRHHPLNEAEVEWITANCNRGGDVFLAKVEKFWACPSIPVPGANLIGKGV